MSMATSVEMRAPVLDHKFVEFCGQSFLRLGNFVEVAGKTF